MKMIMEENWSEGSGKVINAGKHFFLRLAVASVRDVASQRDSDGFTFSRKAMIRTGMALNTNGRWEESQLFPKPQSIVRKHRNHFNGEPVIEDENAASESSGDGSGRSDAIQHRFY